MVIDEILAAKRADVLTRKLERPMAALLEGIQPADRDFEAALRGPAPAFILEIKPRSPSAGPLRAEPDLGPAIASYGRHASAVSVLADQRFFGGSLELLGRVRAMVPQPVLAKDFILEPYQVVEARRAGADAVLLMLSVLDDLRYRACADQARALRMGILTEVHTLGELTRAAELGAPVIGINNRDLRTLGVDLGVTARLAARAPPGPVLIAESGIGSGADVARLRDAVDGFLVGTSVMRAEDPDAAVRELVYGRTKICGLTRGDDARLALDAGATHGGLVLAPESPRRVSPEQAGQVRRAADLQWVGVFVNQAPARVAALAAELGLAAVQLHGEETRDDVDRLRVLLPANCAVWKAVPVRDRIPPPEETGADLVLLDGFSPDRRGGTGQTFDWSILEGLAGRDRYALSGGLTPENVGAALRTGIPLLDVSSGVEREPGRKDPSLVRQFLAGRRGPRRTSPR